MPMQGMGGIMAKYFRWRKEEGCYPLWGPWIVISEYIEVHDYLMDSPLAFPERIRMYEFGFYTRMYHLRARLRTIRRIYDGYE
jgi:hypothetical protein